MKIGDRVRVSASVIVYHHPQHKKQPCDLNGLEGEIISILTEWQGRPISANLPIVVKFSEGVSKPFQAHFRETELETV
jgi:hypothetical protein